MKTKFIALLLLLTLIGQLGTAQNRLKTKPEAFCGYVSQRGNATILGMCDKLDKCEIKYFIKNGTDDVIDENAAIAQAFDAWAAVIDRKFTKTNYEAEADITFQWGGTVGSSAVGQTAPCAVPIPIYFSSTVKWVTSYFPITVGTYNVFRIAIHEIGHALGLDHSDSINSIMYHSPTDNNSLSDQDISAVRILHGANTGPITGPKYLCVGSTATYSRGQFGFWNSTGGVTINSSKTEQMVSVTATSPVPGKLSTSQCLSFDVFTSINQPGAILGTSQICPGEGDGYFTINAVPSAASYVWSASDPSVVLHPNASGTTCTATGITKTFTLSVKAKNPCGISPATTKTVTVKKTYGPPCNGEDLVSTGKEMLMDINSETLEATIYPNPTTENLNLNIQETDQHVSVSIYNAVNGAKLLTKEVSGGKSVLDVTSLPKGNYIMIIENDKNITRKKFSRN
ncbi:matrixin family metalloprotease [Dyadobacter luticola]|uniref:Matrixin family metalloprotease n=1 Tax=Dyadobacter luticola TaxID=1979387 RepID=A0A5R9L359_9BACT|nr:matrixin family metalloprotease [Dyadobacter luticola]TLV02851.1 matrixin family metalloprotease [Dyadobacter luticola]